MSHKRSGNGICNYFLISVASADISVFFNEYLHYIYILLNNIHEMGIKSRASKNTIWPEYSNFTPVWIHE